MNEFVVFFILFFKSTIYNAVLEHSLQLHNTKVLHNRGGTWHVRVAYQIVAERLVRRVTVHHTTRQLSEQHKVQPMFDSVNSP